MYKPIDLNQEKNNQRETLVYVLEEENTVMDNIDEKLLKEADVYGLALNGTHLNSIDEDLKFLNGNELYIEVIISNP
ncbi:hypothetical protein KQI89_00210 [Clostridium sp. MSJ-4]|uniref:Uncharacterized protein n=1 Tax=Clostridium simiarum TaxID=2841506 RepID=A0ABS6EW14_9CLOT|nr:hypothetical protein [Clostridium simiarum]MBU5590178.1 hypothetical protein [Clostridium simiarum]